MNRFGQTKKILILLVLLFTVLSIVYVSSQDLTDISLKQTSQVILIKEYNLDLKDSKSTIVMDYLDKNSQSKFKVQIKEFENEKKLNSWLRNKVENSFNNYTINTNLVFVDENKNYAFWRSGNLSIQIIAIKKGLSEEEELISISELRKESPVFPDSLFNEYLEKYPSNCNDEGCLTEQALKEQLVQKANDWFRQNAAKIKSSNYYKDGIIFCPSNDSRFIKIQEEYLLTDEEIEQFRIHCKDNKSFEIKGADPSEELKECGKEIDNYIKENNLLTYDDEITLEECLHRESYAKEHKSLSSEDINLVFTKRNIYILEEIRFLKNLKEKNNEKVKELVDKSIKDKIEKRNKLHGFTEENNENKATHINSTNNRINIGRYWFEDEE